MSNKRSKFPPAPEKCWEDPEGTKRVWALLARSERNDQHAGLGGGYRHLRFDLVSVADVYDKDKRRIRNTLADATNDLEINSQGDKLEPDKLYAYGVEYRGVHHAGIRKLDAMHKFLSTLEKKLERERREHGDVPDFAHYVVRVARALDCHYIIEKRSGNSWDSYDDSEYRYTGLRSDGKFNGLECSWKVQQLVRDLWSDDDRKAARAHAERQAEEERARKEREAAAAREAGSDAN